MAGKRNEKMMAYNRVSIMESACRVFKEKGIAATTMDDIAKAAEYSKTTVYNYFGNKEELVNQIILEGMDMYRDKVADEAARSKDTADFYKRFCALIRNLHDKQPVYYEGIAGAVSFDEKAPEDDLLRKIYLSGEEANQIVVEQVAKGISSNDIAINTDMKSTMMLMWFCILGIVEKSTLKEAYLTHHTGKTKSEFLKFAFDTLYTLIDKK